MDERRGAPSQRNVEERARELLDGGEEGRARVAETEQEAGRAAKQILEESAERTSDPATVDPTDDNVIRRISDESL